MKILALELSTARGSLAWLNDDVDLVREWPNNRKDSGPFFESLTDVRKQFGVPEKIVVGLGPGSYAGVRIAISAAIGLSFAEGTGPVPSRNLEQHGGRPVIELVGYPSICAIEKNEYCVIGDARRQSFFFARVRANELIEGPILFSGIELRDKIDKLNGKMSIFSSEQLQQFERVTVRYPSALLLAQLAQNPRLGFSSTPLQPIYLREPHITTPK